METRGGERRKGEESRKSSINSYVRPAKFQHLNMIKHMTIIITTIIIIIIILITV